MKRKIVFVVKTKTHSLNVYRKQNNCKILSKMFFSIKFEEDLLELKIRNKYNRNKKINNYRKNWVNVIIVTVHINLLN